MVFETFNHLRRDLRLDPNDWVNAEHARFLKQGGIERTPQNVGYCPEWLLRQSFVCPNGHIFVPDWLAKRPPLMPFVSEGKLFRPGTGQVACPSCATRFEVELPSVPRRDDVLLYGDEAMRDIVTPGCDNRYCVTYTLISRPRLASDDQELLATYRALKKVRIGGDTVVHCKTLFHDDRRRVGRLPSEQVSAFLGEVADLLASWADRIVILNCAGVVVRPQAFRKKEQAACKARVFGPLARVYQRPERDRSKFAIRPVVGDGERQLPANCGCSTALSGGHSNVSSAQLSDSALSKCAVLLRRPN
ncbi:hypothetical protein QZM81_12005 [Burkholderia cepacia]|uniref:hypothetical protein n=1 Tax=Burkholderia cepacia TaxID=292 RepID=UPI00264AA36F|nr:hypothetical protein [Burkholderia cepacia]MDN7856532.1 hypothetical protein [Burkholderia cepacia]